MRRSAVVAAAADVELVHAPRERVVAGDRGPSSVGYSVRPSRARRPCPRSRRAVQVRRAHRCRESAGLSGDLTSGSGIGASSTVPVASVCSEERPELLAEPQRPAVVLADGLDVEVAARQQPVGRGVVDELEGDLVVGVAQGDPLEDPHGPGPAVGRLEVGVDARRRAAASCASWLWCRSRCRAWPSSCRGRARPGGPRIRRPAARARRRRRVGVDDAGKGVRGRSRRRAGRRAPGASSARAAAGRDGRTPGRRRRPRRRGRGR